MSKRITRSAKKAAETTTSITQHFPVTFHAHHTPVRRKLFDATLPAPQEANKSLFDNGGLQKMGNDDFEKKLTSHATPPSSPQKSYVPVLPPTPSSIIPQTPGTRSKTERLTFEVKQSQSVKLPEQLQGLYNVFGYMEMAASIRHGRGARVTFNGIQKDVEKKTKKTFTETHVAQIVHLYPKAYNVKYEKHRMPMGKATPGVKQDLVLRPNLKDDLVGHWRPLSPMKTPTKTPMVSPIKLISPMKSARNISVDITRRTPTKLAATPLLREAVRDTEPKLEGWRLDCRRKIFKHKLVTFIRQKHQRFLKERGVNGEFLSQNDFHPEFDAGTISPVPVAKLTKVGEDMETGFRTIRDYFDSVSKDSPSDVEKTPQQTPTREKCVTTPSSVRKNGLKSPSILQKLRAQAANKKLQDSLSCKADERQIELLEMLRKTIPVVCSQFLRGNMSMGVPRLYSNVKPSLDCSQNDFTEQLKLLSRIAADKCEFIREISGEYFQLKLAAVEAEKPMLKIVQEELARTQIEL